MSLYLNVENFLKEYCEFAELEEVTIQCALDKAEIKLAGNAIFNRKPEIVPVLVGALTAHDLAVKYRHQLNIVGALAVINDRKQPQWKSSKNYYMQTEYGLEYLELIDKYACSIGLDVI